MTSTPKWQNDPVFRGLKTESGFSSYTRTLARLLRFSLEVLRLQPAAIELNPKQRAALQLLDTRLQSALQNYATGAPSTDDDDADDHPPPGDKADRFMQEREEGSGEDDDDDDDDDEEEDGGGSDDDEEEEDGGGSDDDEEEEEDARGEAAHHTGGHLPSYGGPTTATGQSAPSDRWVHIPRLSLGPALLEAVQEAAFQLFASELTYEALHPVAVFAMMLAERKDGQISPANEITSHMAELQWNMRASMVGKVVRPGQGGSSQNSMKMYQDNRLHQWVFLNLDKMTPYGFVKKTINEGAVAAKRERGATATIVRMNDVGDIVEYRGTSISLDEVKKHKVSMAFRAAEALEEALDGTVFHDLLESIQYIPHTQTPRRFYDNPSNSEPGFSFLDDKRNHTYGFQDMWKTLFERLVRSQRLKQAGVWNHATSLVLLNNLTRFAEVLAVATFESFGFPPRATEFVLGLARNLDGRSRSVVIFNGVLIFILRHNKSSEAGQDKPIARPVPEVIKNLIIFFLAAVKPIIKLLREEVLGHLPAAVGHMLNHVFWTGEQNITGKWLRHAVPRSALASFSLKETTRIYTIRGVRHLLKFWGRAFLDRSAFQSPDDSAFFEKAFGHSRSTGEKHYAVKDELSAFLSERQLTLSVVMHQCAHELLGFRPPPQGRMKLCSWEDSAVAKICYESSLGKPLVLMISQPAWTQLSLSADDFASREHNSRQISWSQGSSVARHRLPAAVPLHPETAGPLTPSKAAHATTNATCKPAAGIPSPLSYAPPSMGHSLTPRRGPGDELPAAALTPRQLPTADGPSTSSGPTGITKRKRASQPPPRKAVPKATPTAEPHSAASRSLRCKSA